MNKVNTDKTIPVDASTDGKRNAFSVRCEVVMHSKAYAACLHLCEKRKEGRLDTQYADCSAAIGKKDCPALRMRKEELAAGHAIYFEERIKVQVGFFEKAKQFVGEVVSIAAKVAAPASPQPSKSKPAEKQSAVGSALNVSGGADFAAALNSAAAAPKPEAKAIEIRPGESLLEAARRALQSK